MNCPPRCKPSCAKKKLRFGEVRDLLKGRIWTQVQRSPDAWLSWVLSGHLQRGGQGRGQQDLTTNCFPFPTLSSFDSELSDSSCPPGLPRLKGSHPSSAHIAPFLQGWALWASTTHRAAELGSGSRPDDPSSSPSQPSLH